MTLPAAWALQAGLYSHLSADAGVQSIVGAPPRIHDRIPHDAVFPLLTIGPARIRSVDGSDSAAEHDIRIAALSRWGGRREVRELTDIVHAALHDRFFSVDGSRIVSCRFVFADLLRRPDAETFQSVMRYRIVTETQVAVN